jgi:hypothetical protein
MDPKKRNVLILLGCLVAIAAGVLLVALGVFFAHIVQDPVAIWLAAEAPSDVALGETFTLSIEVQNIGEQEAVELGDLDVGDGYLRGFRLVSVTPDPLASFDSEIGWQTFQFGTELAPGELATFELVLEAVERGAFRGDVDQFVGMQYTTATVSTRVR